MRETLEAVAKRLGELPALAGELVRRRAEVSDALHKALDRAKEIEARVGGEVAAVKNGDGRPVYGNEAARAAEIAQRLTADRAYQEARTEADRFRRELAELDARIEETGRRHRSDANLAYLVASLIGAGLRPEAEAVLAAYAEGCATQTGILPEAVAPGGAEPVQAEEPAPAKGDDLLEGTFKVLEARSGKSPGTVRAWCEADDGTKVAVFGKNGTAKALSAAVGKRVTIRYRKLDKGLFAVKVA
ncbi:MAG: hypothetical protein AB1816_13150 [Bacillota bacterium]